MSGPAGLGEPPEDAQAEDKAAPGRRIRLRLAYEGTRYSGWQAQPGRATVQGTLAEAIRQVSGEDVRPRGSSRTDAGVHALDQVVAFTTGSSLEPEVWVRALNAKLPPDITVIAGDEPPASFDPVSAAVRKRYRYRIHDAPWKPVLQRHLVWRWRGRLDTEAMAEAGGPLVGEHDFTSFETTPSQRISKVRTIYSLTVSRPTVADDRTGAEVWIEVEGNGFLYNMVRIIAGSLVMVGAGRRSPGWLAEALAARHRPAAGPTAPPEGLVLVSIQLAPDQIEPSHASP
jgi:tRNA pseudouridine38-40 synthase